jgi:hypothetical protein
MLEEETNLQEIPVKDLSLDPENPRFLHLTHKSDKGLSQESIEEEILNNDDDIPLLTKTIQKSGVQDPIWVVRQGDGKYVVVEGNRRTVVLKRLVRERVVPPAGVRYDVVRAHVIPASTPQVELILQKARLQAGKKAWGAFNEAALTFQLQQPPFLMATEDIAVDLKIPIAKVKERIENYKLFNDYAKATTDDNPKRFAYFAECPPRVREWFKDSAKNKGEYFKLICPLDGKNKIRSVATRGGLRDFQHVLDDPEALKMLLTDPGTSVEDALAIARDNDITKSIPVIKKLAPLTLELRGLNAAQVEKLKAEVKFKVSLKSLRAACDEVLDRIEDEA